MKQQSKSSCLSKHNHNPDKCSAFTGPEQVQTATHTAQWVEKDAVELACYQMSNFCFCFLAMAKMLISSTSPNFILK